MEWYELVISWRFTCAKTIASPLKDQAVAFFQAPSEQASWQAANMAAVAEHRWKLEWHMHDYSGTPLDILAPACNQYAPQACN